MSVCINLCMLSCIIKYVTYVNMKENDVIADECMRVITKYMLCFTFL